MSALLVENQFFSPYCQTAPDTIYVFNVSDPFAYDPTLPGVWPSFFRFHFEDFTVGDVDNCYVPIAGTACTSSLDTARSAPYQSGSTNWFDTLSDIESAVPKSANGKSYCMLSATNMQDQSALLGYKAIFLQAVDGICYDGKFNCNNAGLFTYFESSGCAGAFESIQMPSSSSNTTLPSLGNLTVQLKTFKSASMIYDWQQNSPVTRLVPQWNIPFDYVAAAFFILAVLIGLYPPAITVYGAIVKKKKPLFLNYVTAEGRILPPRISLKKQQEIRNTCLFAGIDPSSVGLPPLVEEKEPKLILKGNKRPVEKKNREEKIIENMKAMPKRIEQYRLERRKGKEARKPDMPF
ncbi:hypothetical protein HDV04_003959 [Boothiomyces sp. JEL0838]|nr:hypothetical protein HDV04_003959 [Boothiomyces sp. JEL0838]